MFLAIPDTQDKQTHFIEDFENTNADLISVRQEVKNLQRYERIIFWIVFRILPAEFCCDPRAL